MGNIDLNTNNEVLPQVNNKKTKRKINLPKINLTIVIICITIVAVLFFISGMKVSKINKVNVSSIAERIDKIAEISSLKYNYSSVVTLKDSVKLKDISIPFTGKSFIIKYNGYIKFGTNLKEKNIKFSENKKKITITLLNSKVLDNVADTKNIMVYDEKYSIFNRYGAQDMIDEIAKEQKRIENILIKEGYITKANEQLKILLTSLLNDMGFEKVEIIFK